MQINFSNSTIGELSFNSEGNLNTEQARAYALNKLAKYSGCTVGKVYVNGELVLENVKC